MKRKMIPHSHRRLLEEERPDIDMEDEYRSYLDYKQAKWDVK